VPITRVSYLERLGNTSNYVCGPRAEVISQLQTRQIE
jgi:hypothetical protein